MNSSPAASPVCASSSIPLHSARQRFATLVKAVPPSALIENSPSLNRFAFRIGLTERADIRSSVDALILCLRSALEHKSCSALLSFCTCFEKDDAGHHGSEAGIESARQAMQTANFLIEQATIAASQVTIAGWFTAQVAINGNAIALQQGARTLSYRELNDRVNRLVGWLAAQGVTRGDRIAILSENRSEYVEVELA